MTILTDQNRKTLDASYNEYMDYNQEPVRWRYDPSMIRMELFKRAKMDASFVILEASANEIIQDFNTLENQAVKISGNQAIDGVKTFNESPVCPTPIKTARDTTVATTAFVKTQIDELINWDTGY